MAYTVSYFFRIVYQTGEVRSFETAERTKMSLIVENFCRQVGLPVNQLILTYLGMHPIPKHDCLLFLQSWLVAVSGRVVPTEGTVKSLRIGKEATLVALVTTTGPCQCEMTSLFV